MCVSIYISRCNMQHLNSGFHKLKVNNSTHIKNVGSSKNMKEFTKPFKHNCKILNCTCFNIL